MTTQEIRIWPDFVKQKLMPLVDTDDNYSSYIEAQNSVIEKHTPSLYRSPPTVKPREQWLNEIEREAISSGPEYCYLPASLEKSYESRQVFGYFGEEGGPYDCRGVVVVKLNNELFFFEVSGYHDSWDGGELYWDHAELVPAPDLTPEYVPGHYRYPGNWDTKALIKLGVFVPPLPDNK